MAVTFREHIMKTTASDSLNMEKIFPTYIKPFKLKDTMHQILYYTRNWSNVYVAFVKVRGNTGCWMLKILLLVNFLGMLTNTKHTKIKASAKIKRIMNV